MGELIVAVSIGHGFVNRFAALHQAYVHAGQTTFAAVQQAVLVFIQPCQIAHLGRLDVEHVAAELMLRHEQVQRAACAVFSILDHGCAAFVAGIVGAHIDHAGGQRSGHGVFAGPETVKAIAAVLIGFAELKLLAILPQRYLNACNRRAAAVFIQPCRAADAGAGDKAGGQPGELFALAYGHIILHHGGALLIEGGGRSVGGGGLLGQLKAHGIGAGTDVFKQEAVASGDGFGDHTTGLIRQQHADAFHDPLALGLLAVLVFVHPDFAGDACGSHSAHQLVIAVDQRLPRAGKRLLLRGVHNESVDVVAEDESVGQPGRQGVIAGTQAGQAEGAIRGGYSFFGRCGGFKGKRQASKGFFAIVLNAVGIAVAEGCALKAAQRYSAGKAAGDFFAHGNAEGLGDGFQTVVRDGVAAVDGFGHLAVFRKDVGEGVFAGHHTVEEVLAVVAGMLAQVDFAVLAEQANLGVDHADFRLIPQAVVVHIVEEGTADGSSRKHARVHAGDFLSHGNFHGIAHAPFAHQRGDMAAALFVRAQTGKAVLVLALHFKHVGAGHDAA